MLGTSNDEFITLNNIESGEGDELIISEADAAKVGKRAKTFVGDCSLTVLEYS